jgi:hypothetical protein
MKSFILFFAIFASISAVTFDCIFYTRDFGTAGPQYTCYNPSLGSVYDSEELTDVFGTHEADKSNSDVTGLWVQNYAALTFYPRGIQNFFPNLKAIFFYNNNIRSLSGDELSTYQDLLLFGISINRFLERLPGNLFAQNSQVKELWMYENGIKYAGSGLLDGLQNLTSALFENNYCINLRAQNAEEVQEIIETLRNNCTDIETTTIPSSCGDTNEIVCQLQEQNQILIANNEEMNGKLDVLSEENSQIKLLLEEVLEGISELQNRPCRT